jgi:glycine cleavage system aminomethyltransferase T
MPLYGHELDGSISPLEAARLCRETGKARFYRQIGASGPGGPKRTRVGLKVTGRGIAREHSPVSSAASGWGRLPPAPTALIWAALTPWPM